eukprot:CAMPEP_0119055180 /NCGR_PEP_ID=MMETSP1177-20130426/75561_1 /TAXON_ID=2985 /ORGANISM="Ochromonas sp, Strain CCMP1899" /LENGTH=535 /DNA_ID=CAMNT_0007035659 /DNA_START=505 /DNA_END=2113 /DNA_ORIENTATION=+
MRLQKIKFQSFMKYYLRETKLGLYSMEKELKRMDFYLIKDGITITDHDMILSIFEKYPLNDLWRLANQSIYAEILIALQENFLKPELSISIASTSSIFHLNFDLNQVTAESIFQFMTLNNGGNGRLILGSVKCIVEVDLKNKNLRQEMSSPTLEIIFDHVLNSAAVAIVSLEGCPDPNNFATSVSNLAYDIQNRFSNASLNLKNNLNENNLNIIEENEYVFYKRDSTSEKDDINNHGNKIIVDDDRNKKIKSDITGMTINTDKDFDMHKRKDSNVKKEENFSNPFSEGFIGVLGGFMGAHKSSIDTPSSSSLLTILTNARDSDNIFSSSNFHSSSYTSSLLSTASRKPTEQSSPKESSVASSSEFFSEFSSQTPSKISSGILFEISSGNHSFAETSSSAVYASSIYSLQKSAANEMSNNNRKNGNNCSNSDIDDNDIDIETHCNSTIEENLNDSSIIKDPYRNNEDISDKDNLSNHNVSNNLKINDNHYGGDKIIGNDYVIEKNIENNNESDSSMNVRVHTALPVKIDDDWDDWT